MGLGRWYGKVARVSSGREEWHARAMACNGVQRVVFPFEIWIHGVGYLPLQLVHIATVAFEVYELSITCQRIKFRQDRSLDRMGRKAIPSKVVPASCESEQIYVYEL